MGGDDRDPPFFFAKPADAVVLPGANPAYPMATGDLHHEIELVAAIGRSGAEITPDQALDLVFGYAVGVDLTRRDLQAQAREKRQPWDAAKGFDQSAPISAIRRWTGAPPQGGIRLSVNDEVRQQAVERGRGHLRGVQALAAGAGRPDLHRHAGGRRPAGPRRPR
jgi:fumarylpyruvate hydrolase